jgi:hypothetical protein
VTDVVAAIETELDRQWTRFYENCLQSWGVSIEDERPERIPEIWAAEYEQRNNLNTLSGEFWEEYDQMDGIEYGIALAISVVRKELGAQ